MQAAQNYSEGNFTSALEQGDTDDLFAQIKRTRLVAATVWFFITIVGLLGDI